MVAPRSAFCVVFLPEAQETNNYKSLMDFWRLSLGNLYTVANGTTPKKSKIILALEALERFRERQTSLPKEEREKVRNLDGSGHKGLAEFSIFCDVTMVA